MTTFFIILGIVFLLLIITFTTSFLLVNKEMKTFFYKRADRGEYTLQDKKITDFKKLNATEFTFYNKGETLKGKIYYRKNPDDDVILFCHGYGAGHEAYLTEINYYVKNGYTVIGFDYRGCVNSDGLLFHFGSSIEDLNACYQYLLKNFNLQNKNLYLWGHSWGAYTALCGTEFINAKKVIALCPFNTPIEVLTKFTLPYEKKLSYFLKPFRFLFLKLKYKKFANISAFKKVEKFNGLSLIILGKQDTVVPKFKYSFTSEKIKVITLQDKGHNPYNTVEGETYLNKTLLDLSNSKDIKKTLSQVDYDLITQQDKKVMQLTLDFLND